MEERAIKPLFTESSSPSARFIACLILSFLLISVDHQHQHLASLRAMLAVAVYPLQYAASLPVRLALALLAALPVPALALLVLLVPLSHRSLRWHVVIALPPNECRGLRFHRKVASNIDFGGTT